MASVSVDLADAVVDHMNTQAFEGQKGCKRLAFPKLKISEGDGLVFSVFVGPRSSERITRGAWIHNYMCFVVVQRKLTSTEADETSEVDDLASTVEAIETSFEDATADFAAMEFIGFDSGADRLPFNLELLHDTGVFAAVITLTFSDNG